MAEIIQFPGAFEQDPSEEERYIVSYPTLQEIEVLKELKNEFQGRFLPIYCWSGDQWKELFADHMERGKTLGAEPWDLFAVTLDKLLGTRFVTGPDGKPCVEVSGLPEHLKDMF